MESQQQNAFVARARQQQAQAEGQGQGQGQNPVPGPPSSLLNKFAHNPSHLLRLTIVRLKKHLKLGTEWKDLYQSCVLLSKAMDATIAHKQNFSSVSELPPLVKQVFKYKDDDKLLPAIMALMLSVKSACRCNWFGPADMEELLIMFQEVSACFAFGNEIQTSEINNASHLISQVTKRYYPRLSLGSVLLSLEAKPGFECHVTDIHIPEKPPTNEKICLFVVRMENVDTSACLVTPPQVKVCSFLINGKFVEKRSTGMMDPGPQMPTDLTGMLKISANLMQVLGEFNGNYLIAVVRMAICPISSTPSQVYDYIATATATSANDADDEVVEGPSKITLNCPISYQRISTPVKGSMCRHHQCFDYKNFIEINSRRPTWRCPYCNRQVSYLDLRIDQKMLTILKGVGEDVSDVLIYKDGQWKAIVRNEDGMDGSLTDNSSTVKNSIINGDSGSKDNIKNDVIDLTDESRETILNDERMNSNILQNCSETSSLDKRNRESSEIPDIKPDIEALRRMMNTNSSCSTQTSDTISHLNNTFNAHAVAEALASDRAHVSTSLDVFSGFMPTPDHLYSSRIGEATPILTDAVIPSLIRAPVEAQDLAVAMNSTQCVTSPGTYEPSRIINRNPIAIHALPAQTQVGNSFTRVRNNPSLHNSFPPSTSSDATFLSEFGREQMLSRQNPTQHCSPELRESIHVQLQSQPQLVSSFMPAMAMQNLGQSGVSNMQWVPTPGRSSSQFPQEQQNQQQLLNNWLHQMAAHSQPRNTQFQDMSQAGSQSNVVFDIPNLTPSVINQQGQSYQRATYNPRPASGQYIRSAVATTSSSQKGTNVQSIDQSRFGNGDPRWQIQTSTNMSGFDHTWRPAGRMRGSIPNPGRAGANNTNTFLNQQMASRPLLRQNQTAGQLGLTSANHLNLLQ